MRKLFNPFVFMITLILGSGYLFLFFRLASTPLQRCLLALCFLSIWAVPVVYWIFDRDDSTEVDLWFQRFSFLMMGLISFLVIYTLLRDIGLFLVYVAHAHLPLSSLQWFQSFWGRDPFTETQLLLAQIEIQSRPLILLLSICSLIAGARLALTPPKVRNITVPIFDLPEALNGFKIAQITDLHIGKTIREDFVRQVVARTNSSQPDIIVLTGDIVDGGISDLKQHYLPLKELNASYGVYYVTGNHEYYWDGPAWVSVFEKELGFKVLENQGITFDYKGHSMGVGGIVDPAISQFIPGAYPDLKAVASDLKNAAFKILLAHQPKCAPTADELGFDLQISGHTHGGQSFPWTLVAKWVHPIVLGLKRRGRMWVYVGPGTGTWGPPVRFGTTPEIALLSLTRSDVKIVK